MVGMTTVVSAVGFGGRRMRIREPKSSEKPFDISKREVWEAYERVKANKNAPGVDGCSIEEFEADRKNNLYKIWSASSRMGGEAVMSCS
jgi:retron-type reverse transcriptase